MPQGDPQGRMHGFQLWANLPSSLKMTAPRYQDVVVEQHPRGHRRRRHARAGRLRRLLGEARTGGRHRRRSALSRHLGAARHAQALPVEIRGTPLRTFRGLRHVSRRLGAAGRADRTGRLRRRAPCETRSATARSYSSTAATKSSSRPVNGNPIPAGLRPADGGTRRLARPDRHEHARRAAAGVRRASQRHLHQVIGGIPTLPAVIISPREGRKGPGVATWFAEQARLHGKFRAEIADLGIIDLPMMDEQEHPRLGRSARSHQGLEQPYRPLTCLRVRHAEYAGAPPSLLNALDYLVEELA